MNENYYVGIDMGTDSVGWAVTDDEYRLCKARGKDLWGVYLFEEDKGGAERRSFRVARRRTARVRQRLMLLQSLFCEEIAKTDPLFFLRLNNSSLLPEDKDGRLSTRDGLFADPGFADKHYFSAYPTIYHLRAALLKGEIRDVRLLYLGIHHILKNRGHFLFETQNFSVGDTDMIRGKFFEINAFLEERELPAFDFEKLLPCLDILRERRGSKKDRQRELGELLRAGKEKHLLAGIKAMTGAAVSLKDLFSLEEDGEELKTFSFEKFDDSTFAAIEKEVGAEDAALVLLLKSVYDWTVLCEIMGEERFISLAKVKVYEKHKADLQWLKGYVRTVCPERYAEVFRRREKKNNYAAYIGMDRQKGFSKCKKEDFYDFLKKEIRISDERVLAEMGKGEFLPKAVTGDNSVIPCQVQLMELKEILTQAEKIFPFLTEQTDGLTVSEKVISLMTFRIPYYVGPLHTGSSFAWAERKPGKEKVSVTPWNFDDVIDRDGSEEKFIRRMTNKCTYLPGEDVLPASSFLYSEFAFLNELNNLRVYGERNEEVRRIIYDYAGQHKKVSLKRILTLLIQKGMLPAGSKAEEVFSGLDGDFKNALSSWNDFAFLGEKREKHRKMCEDLILWITLISDKKRLEKRIRREYGDLLTEEEIRRLKGLNYVKWGRLSARFLDGITCDRCPDDAGNPMTIIQAMREKGENLMQLLSGKYGFQEVVDAEQAESLSGKVTYQTIRELFCPPMTKRAIWRTVELVREIVGIQGRPPKKLFVETARETGDESRKGKRTVSRKQQILDLYQSIRSEEREWKEEIEALPDSAFNSDRLMLYYRQMGKCMYTGKPLRLEDVFNKNICDKDHIYPRSKIKDDSLDNLVLVYRTENMAKKDVYPLSGEIRGKMTPYWQFLREKGLISEKKYARLTRSSPLTQDELTDFINRQLVTTRQSTKEAARILKRLLPETEIVYSRAANANEFKDKFKLVKVRELNDLHHAKDAYVNIIVGNVYNTKFNHNAAVYYRNGQESCNLERLYDQDIPGAWKLSEKDRLCRTYARNTCRVVRMTLMGHGELFNLQPVPAGTNEGLVPLKQKGPFTDTAKYGGYNKAATAYFLLVRSKGKKGKIQLSFEAYPLWRDLQFGGSKEDKLRFCLDQGLAEPQILFDCIKINTLFCLDGSYVYLRGKTGDRVVWCNANELFLEEENTAALKEVCKFLRARKEYNRPDMKAPEKITAEANLRLYDALTEKLDSQVYAGLPVKGQVPLLRENREKFSALCREEQCGVLVEILHLMQCNSVLSDLTLLGGSKHAGANFGNRFIQDRRVKMIFQSPTGHYHQVFNLNDFADHQIRMELRSAPAPARQKMDPGGIR